MGSGDYKKARILLQIHKHKSGLNECLWLPLKSFTAKNLNRNIENRFDTHVTDPTLLILSMI